MDENGPASDPWLMAIVAVRAPPRFGLTVHWTLPTPSPESAERVTHGLFAEAVQVHCPPAGGGRDTIAMSNALASAIALTVAPGAGFVSFVQGNNPLAAA